MQYVKLSAEKASQRKSILYDFSIKENMWQLFEREKTKRVSQH